MNIQYDFSGQTAIVTGGARGIGRAIAAQFVRFGAQVWTWDIDPVELDGAQSLRVDVTKADEIEEGKYKNDVEAEADFRHLVERDKGCK